MTAPIPTLDGLAQVAERYDLLLCDVWGVLHDGQKAHVPAGEALIRYRGLPGARPRRVILVSNAPRPGDGVGRILDRFGVPREAYDAILTSGDLTRGLIAERPGARIRHLGPERDLGIFQGLDLSLVPEVEADLVVCTGLFDDRSETADDYRDELMRLAARGLTLICANPDLVVESGNRLIPCAGLLAAAYAELGGAVIYAGKPHRPVYEAALAKAADLAGAPVDPGRVMAIGDAIRTDIAGACGFGIASLLVARGIHAEELGVSAEHHRLGDVAEWLGRQAVHPDAVIERLVW
ncbi:MULTISPECIES: TIGR01459 family HAD-type hydrolase [unclassified Methylobacterium]|uniref:TIGR01459 family HAD-type hydrolase n=1 Tax=unclassified Methylobacterium TaxID=2615210 RepID=UPI0011C201E9|nr:MULTISPECIES: TIGR01459 family HAD-type hydrolase [unclassified Methylobacterium]QEE41468.1 TIGR01459 family HAD-type hydrolase [Methylobacterium sp. WL1]TXM98518.1 TIGR01459 family HAD-type hydrolase [Methylobacterium sp. WL64]TXN53994.1 TIGR01459 family HAD-type hydrolase [Methylobacterium sp. WL2]